MNSEARLSGSVLEIEVNASGMMDAADMAINLNNLNGTLTNANFLLV